jgi:WD40 repeat protein
VLPRCTDSGHDISATPRHHGCDPPPRIFLSYTRTDLHAAMDLRRLLETELGEGAVWHDVRNLAGDHWWTEIEEAIRGQSAVEHVVLLASAEALTRPVVRREWRLAWREGKALTNVFWSARPGFTSPALGEDHEFVQAKSMLDLSLPDRWQALITRLKEPGRGARRPFMAPAMPEGYIARREEFGKLKASLLDAKGNAVAISAALRGAGGFGKTVLAQALVHDDDIQDVFHDGVLWVTLGERPSLVAKLADLLETLTGESQGFTEVSAAANKLRELLAERRCLLVIDDVWSEGHLRPFMEGAPFTARLITTRRDDILPKGALRVAVDAMKQSEAVELLSQGLGAAGAAERAALRTLATERLGEWPVLIRLINGFLRKEVERGAALGNAIQQANERLDRKKLTVFDRNDEGAREAAVESTIRASVDYLVEEIGRSKNPSVYNSQRYDELAVFPEDVEVPISTIARLWGRVAEVDEIEARDLLKHFYSLALLQALDLKRGTVRLHDVMRKYLTQKQAAEALMGMHRQFVWAYDAASGPDIEDREERRYFYEWYPTHLAQANERETLDAVLLDAKWMQRKLNELRGPLGIVEDYRRFSRKGAHRVLGRTLQLAAGILSRDRRQLMAQLLGRLMHRSDQDLVSFLLGARNLIPRPSLVTKRASLDPPRNEYARIEGHDDSVTALCLLPDGTLASGSLDQSIRIWDLGSYMEVSCLRGHADVVTAICGLADGRLVSASRDSTIRLWNLENDIATGALVGRANDVTAICELPGNRIATASVDGSVRTWDVNNSKETYHLAGHTQGVTSLALLDDGRLATASLDATVRLFDVVSGKENGLLTGHTAAVNAICKMDRDYLASASDDGTIRIWNIATRLEQSCFQSGNVIFKSLCLLPDGLVASGCDDNTIRTWDIKKGVEVARLEGHIGWVSALEALPDGRLASASRGGGEWFASRDNTIRIWQVGMEDELKSPSVRSRNVIASLCAIPSGRLASGARLTVDRDSAAIQLWNVETGVNIGRLRSSQQESVHALCLLPRGLLASASGGRELLDGAGAIRLWDIEAQREVVCFNGHSKAVLAICQLHDGRLASGSDDNTIRIWKESLGEVACLRGHTAAIRSLCSLADGRLASGSQDGVIRLWDVDSHVECGQLRGHQSWVNSLCELPGRQMASASDDGTIRVWSVISGLEIGVLRGHTHWVNAVKALSNGRLVSGSDDRTIRVWDTVTLEAIAAIEVDAPVNCFEALPDGSIVAGDQVGQLHWLELAE